MLLSRRKLLTLLGFICLLPIVSLVVTYRNLPTLNSSSAIAKDLDLSPSSTSLSPSKPLETVSSTMSYKKTIDETIQNKHVVVFSKSYCPYCRNAKQLLKSLDVEAEIFELDQMDDGSDWQNYLAEKTGQRTVPNIFIGGKHVGGSSDLEAKHKSGELKQLLGSKA
ncbi:hypothetical protein JCM3765_000524 [Sporobolomyces pararoseus]